MKEKRKKPKMIKIVLILATMILAVPLVFLLASGIFTRPEYLQPWEKSYVNKFDDPRLQLVSVGILAANGHNLQPWRIELDENNNVFYLYADSRRMTQVDPDAAQIMISQGTFLEYLKTAGLKFGYRTDIEIFPYGEYDEHQLAKTMISKPVAKIVIAKTKAADASLFDYMYLPDTNRGPYKKLKISNDDLDALKALNDKPDLQVKTFADDENKKQLSEFALAGAKIESGVHRINVETAEIFRANEYEKNKFRYGFSIEGQGTKGIAKHFMQGLLTIVPAVNNEKASAEMFMKSTKNSVDNTPAYFMIISKGNSRKSQVEAGMLYSRMVLAAHAKGLVMQPLSQSIEIYPEMMKLHDSIHQKYAGDGETIQMFIRIGEPTVEFPPSMRQDVKDFIVDK